MKRQLSSRLITLVLFCLILPLLTAASSLANEQVDSLAPVLFIQTEDFSQIGGEMELVFGEGARGDSNAIEVPNGANNPDTEDFTRYTFRVPVSGLYHFVGRYFAPTTGDDSFCVRIERAGNGGWEKFYDSPTVECGDDIYWDLLPDANVWQRRVLTDGWTYDYEPVNLDLSAADVYRVTIISREDGARLDWLMLQSGAAAAATSLAMEAAGEENSSAEAALTIQMEDFSRIGGEMELVFAQDVQGVGRAIEVPNGANDPETEDYASYGFRVPVSGVYHFIGRLLAPSTMDDSFCVRLERAAGGGWESIYDSPGVECGSDIYWDPFTFTDEWQRYPLRDGWDYDYEDINLDLSAEESYRITIIGREDGTRLDWLRLQPGPVGAEN